MVFAIVWSHFPAGAVLRKEGRKRLLGKWRESGETDAIQYRFVLVFCVSVQKVKETVSPHGLSRKRKFSNSSNWKALIVGLASGTAQGSNDVTRTRIWVLCSAFWSGSPIFKQALHLWMIGTCSSSHVLWFQIKLLMAEQSLFSSLTESDWITWHFEPIMVPLGDCGVLIGSGLCHVLHRLNGIGTSPYALRWMKRVILRGKLEVKWMKLKVFLLYHGVLV